MPMPCRLLGATPFLALRAQNNRPCSPTRACYRPPGSWSSLLEYFFRASVNTSGRLGKFNLILTSWTCAGTTARAILVSLATTSTSFNSLPCIGLLGVANKISELCSLHDLLLISLSPTLCASRVTGTFEKDIWPRLLDDECISKRVELLQVGCSLQLFSLLLSSFFRFFFTVLASTFLMFACHVAFNMTKPDSVTASLPSPRDLRMASEHELDVPMTLTSGVAQEVTSFGYTSPSVPIRMPGASSSSDPTFQHHAPLQPTQWRQRNVHTIPHSYLQDL